MKFKNIPPTIININESDTIKLLNFVYFLTNKMCKIT